MLVSDAEKHYICANFQKVSNINQSKQVMLPNLTEYIQQSIVRHWNMDALTDYKGATLQYKDVARKMAKFHIVLEAAGIKTGDKVAICGRNSAHWAVAFLATVTYGAVIVPILHEFKSDNIHNIVNHSEAKLLLVGERVWENLDEKAMPALLGIASLEDFSVLISRHDGLLKAYETRNAIYGERYPRNSGPSTSTIPSQKEVTSWRSLTIRRVRRGIVRE